MRIVGVMPIKTQNERLPGKNTRPLRGRPLMLHALGALAGLEMVDELFVYTSDPVIGKILPDGVTLLLRPEELDRPEANFTQIMDHFIESIDADIYAYMHATAPFLRPATMARCIEAVRSGHVDSAFCAVKIQDFLWANGKPLNFDPENLPRSQDLNPIYRETSGIYVFTRRAYRAHHARVSGQTHVEVVGPKEAIDINTYEDFLIAEALYDVDF